MQVISQADPDLVALHCQEIGGKDFEIQMPKVTEFVRYSILLCTYMCIYMYIPCNLRAPSVFSTI